MRNLWKWLNDILKSAFEESIKYIISAAIIAVLAYSVELLWPYIRSLMFPDGIVKNTTVSLQQGRVGEKYNSTLTAEVDGIAKKVEWAFNSLPVGLFFNGEAIEGTPQIAGQYDITVTATSGTKRASRTLPLIINERFTLQPPTPSQKPNSIEPDIETKENDTFSSATDEKNQIINRSMLGE